MLVRSRAVTALVLALCAACGGSSSSSGSSSNASNPDSATLDVGPEGGVLEVSQPSRPLFGVRVTVPPGALTDNIQLRVTEVRQTVLPSDDGHPSGLTIELEPAGTVFQSPIHVTLPYFDEDDDGLIDGDGAVEQELVPFIEMGDGTWQALELLSRDAQANRVTFPTSSVSRFSSRPWPHLDRGPVKIYYEPYDVAQVHFMDPASYAVARETVLDAIHSGTAPAAPWKSETDCLGWTFEEAASADDADLVIRWRPLSMTLLCQSPIQAQYCHWLAFTSCFVDPNAPAGCDTPAPRCQITFNEDRWLELHMTPSADPIPTSRHDLFSIAAHEFAHVLGLPPECHSAGPPCNTLIPLAPSGHSVIDPVLFPGEDQRSLTSEDIDFFTSRHPLHFEAQSPTGTMPIIQPEPISVTVSSVCDRLAVEYSSPTMELRFADGSQMTVSPPELMVNPISNSRMSVEYLPAQAPPQGEVCVRVRATDELGQEREVSWTFVAAGPPPDARFNASPRNGPAPLVVHFNNNTTGDVTDWLWTFGDGQQSTQESPSHVYTTPGIYTVSLTAMGPTGSSTKTRPDYIDVRPPELNCNSGVQLRVTELPGDLIRVEWCTGDDVLDQGAQFWTLQVEAGGFCGWQYLFTAEDEPEFSDVFQNGLGSNYCLRVVVTTTDPDWGDCITDVIAIGEDGPGCN
ncbi:MAG: PKD domain-containing protein [bacterium]|nr:PKD domain-containing protein [bacterium]